MPRLTSWHIVLVALVVASVFNGASAADNLGAGEEVWLSFWHELTKAAITNIAKVGSVFIKERF